MPVGSIAAVSASPALLTSARPTRQLRLAKSFADARPMPEPPPVMKVAFALSAMIPLPRFRRSMNARHWRRRQVSRSLSLLTSPAKAGAQLGDVHWSALRYVTSVARLDPGLRRGRPD